MSKQRSPTCWPLATEPPDPYGAAPDDSNSSATVSPSEKRRQSGEYVVIEGLVPRCPKSMPVPGLLQGRPQDALSGPGSPCSAPPLTAPRFPVQKSGRSALVHAHRNGCDEIMTNEFGMDVLTDDECWDLLRTATVGRLAVDVGGRPDIYPINFVVDESAIVFRTGAGTKLAAAALMHHVAFEIDGYDPTDRSAWSVVIKGWADQVQRMEAVFEAEELPLYPWAAHPKPNFVKVAPREMTGRRFHVVDNVSPDTSTGWDLGESTPDATTPASDAGYHRGEPYMRPG